MTFDPKPALRSALLQAMHDLPEDDDKELTRVNGFWRRYRFEVEEAQVEVGQASRHLEEMIWPTPQWAKFKKALDRRRQRSPQYKEGRCKYSAQWYQEKGKALRSTPEARERANRLRRERYARAKANTSTP